MMTPRLYDIAQVDVGSLINMHQAGRRQRLSEIASQREEARHQREEEQYQAGLKKQAALASLIPQVLEGGSSGGAGGGTLSKMYLGGQGNNTGAAGSATGQPAPQAGTPTSGRSTLNRSALAQLYALDPEAGKQAYELFTSMDDRQREQAKEQYDTLAAVAQSVKGLPYEQRRAALGQMVPQLQAMGISAEMVQGFDPTDTAIDGFTAQVLGVKGVLEQQNSDRTYNLDVERFGETRRHNQNTEALTRRGQDITVRGQDISRENSLRTASSSSLPKPPAGYRYAQGGDLEPIPGGPAAQKVQQTEEKQRLALQGQEQKARALIADIDEAIQDVGTFTAGFGTGTLAGIRGTPAYNLERKIDTIKANLGFQELAAMRAASPTGGALGAVTERELAFLQATVSSLDAGQSPEELRRGLTKARQHYQNLLSVMRQGRLTAGGEAPEMLRDRSGPGQQVTDRAPQVQSLYDEFGLED